MHTIGKQASLDRKAHFMKNSDTEIWFNVIKLDNRVNPERTREYPINTNYLHDFDFHVAMVDEIAFSIKNTYYSFFKDNKTA